MRVLAVGMFDRTYPRNRVVLEAMRRRGIVVEVCHVPVWELQRDKERGYAGLWNRAKLVARLITAQLTLLFRWLTHRYDADVIWIGFPGHCDMPLAWLMGKCTGRPVVFDAFISWYDSAVRDLGRPRPRPLPQDQLHRPLPPLVGLRRLPARRPHPPRHAGARRLLRTDVPHPAPETRLGAGGGG